MAAAIAVTAAETGQGQGMGRAFSGESSSYAGDDSFAQGGGLRGPVTLDSVPRVV